MHAEAIDRDAGFLGVLADQRVDAARAEGLPLRLGQRGLRLLFAMIGCLQVIVQALEVDGEIG